MGWTLCRTESVGARDSQVAIKELEDQLLNDTSPLPTRDGIWNMGHIPTKKYSDLRAQYLNQWDQLASRPVLGQ